MTASERIRAARVALAEFNSILEENGDEPTTFEELKRAGIMLMPVEVEAAASPLYS